MKNRLSRLLKVLDWYPPSGTVDVDALALELHTSAATIRRDLRDLRDAGAFEADAEPDTGTGAAPAASLSALLRTSPPDNDVAASSVSPRSDDQELAMYVGARFLASEGDEAQGELAAAVLHAVQQRATGELAVRMVDADARFRFGPRAGERKVRLTVAQAIVERRVLRVSYRGERDAAPRVRELEPFVQLFVHDRWLFMAWCREARDVRQFRHERCLETELTEQYFQPRQGLDANSWLAGRRVAVPAARATGATRG